MYHAINTVHLHGQPRQNFAFNSSNDQWQQLPSSSSGGSGGGAVRRRIAGSPCPTLLSTLAAIQLSAIMPYLPTTALIALRSTSRDLNALFLPMLFGLLGHVKARLSPDTFSEKSLQALHRIGSRMRKLTLTLAHSADMAISLVPRDPAAAAAAGIAAIPATAAPQRQPQPCPRLDALVPLPRDSDFGESGNFELLPFAHQCKPAKPELYEAAIRTSGWRRLFCELPALRELILRAPLPSNPDNFASASTPLSAIAIASPMQRSVVDEALKTIVHVWDFAALPSPAAPYQPRLCLTALEWDGHAGGLMALDPRASWDGRGVATGWWAAVRRLVVRIDPRSLADCEDWERGAASRVLADMLDAMGQQLVFVSIDAGGLDSPCVSVATTAEPAVVGGGGGGGGEGVGRQMMPRLVEMELDSVATAWADLERFLNARAPKVVRLTAGRRVVFREGDDGWRGLYAQWEFENVSRSERDPFVLRRKDDAVWMREPAGYGGRPAGPWGEQGQRERGGCDSGEGGLSQREQALQERRWEEGRWGQGK